MKIDIAKVDVYEAIADGVERAIWRMITNATQMPCHDFYDTLKDAAEKAFTRLADSLEDKIIEQHKQHAKGE